MPVVFSNPNFPNQVGQSTQNQSYVTQLNFGQMLREVCQWNSAVDPMWAGRMINNRYRQIIARRSWYGLKVMGQIIVPKPYSTGQATVTVGQKTVTGTGTTWDQSLVGQQFRVNFTEAYETIVSVDQVHQTLQLAMPYAGNNSQTSGYQILAAYFALDNNIKRMLWAVNQLMGWPMDVNVPVESINGIDPWRTSLGFSTTIATRAITAAGGFQVEIWPGAFQRQVFPFEAYTQPPDMQADTDAPVSFIRSDVIVTGAICDALLWQPKKNTFYDPQTAVTIAAEKGRQFQADISEMENEDNNVDQRDVTWDYAQGGGGGAMWAQNHDV